MSVPPNHRLRWLTFRTLSPGSLRRFAFCIPSWASMTVRTVTKAALHERWTCPEKEPLAAIHVTLQKFLIFEHVPMLPAVVCVNATAHFLLEIFNLLLEHHSLVTGRQRNTG